VNDARTSDKMFMRVSAQHWPMEGVYWKEIQRTRDSSLEKKAFAWFCRRDSLEICRLNQLEEEIQNLNATILLIVTS